MFNPPGLFVIVDSSCIIFSIKWIKNILKRERDHSDRVAASIMAQAEAENPTKRPRKDSGVGAPDKKRNSMFQGRITVKKRKPPSMSTNCHNHTSTVFV